MPSHLSGQAPRSELRRRVVEDPVGAAHEIDHLYTALADARGELKCREQEIKALLEPLRKLVEGRTNPTAAARGWYSVGFRCKTCRHSYRGSTQNGSPFRRMWLALSIANVWASGVAAAQHKWISVVIAVFFAVACWGLSDARIITAVFGSEDDRAR